MRTIFLASLSVFAGAAVALADGYEPQPVTLAPAGQDWTGAYVGVNAGWMTTDVGGPLFIGGISTFKSDIEDTVVGFHLGYLKQWGSLLASRLATRLRSTLIRGTRRVQTP